MVEGLKIVDNFFENPHEIRKHALSLRTYDACDFFNRSGIYSGYRTFIQNSTVEYYIIQKLENILERKISYLSRCIHLNTSVSRFGCPHADVGGEQQLDIAGVIYLNENAPINSGTTLYDKEPESSIESYIDKMQIVYNVNIPANNAVKVKCANEIQNFKNSLKVIAYSENIFNRLIIYPAQAYHSPEKYFGETLEDGRLTIALHGKFAD